MYPSWRLEKRFNQTNASSRSIESFFSGSITNEKVDDGEAVQIKGKKEYLEREVENVDGVAEAKTS